ncbi:hypothetical protein NDU88_004640 [Pleurodeles waltl]|uniref:Uncharacterized protein n=1 Tax=Pleurodeles waltl TaxID=8319 RepID=A0AAV7W8Z7_PLEWA|nr:hypothetical protein NDU88_004640 [Pleurodeles waltl]
MWHIRTALAGSQSEPPVQALGADPGEVMGGYSLSQPCLDLPQTCLPLAQALPGVAYACPKQQEHSQLSVVPV